MFYDYKPFRAASAELLEEYKEYFTLMRDAVIAEKISKGEIEQTYIDKVEKIYAERRADAELRVRHEQWWREDNPNWKNRPWYAFPEDVPPDVLEKEIQSAHRAWKGKGQSGDETQS